MQNCRKCFLSCCGTVLIITKDHSSDAGNYVYACRHTSTPVYKIF